VLVAPEEVMQLAVRGSLTKHALATLLTLRARRQFYEACAAIESRYTELCRAKNDPCLDSGCSAEGERCLQPLLEAGTEYHKACGGEWATLFADPDNRDPSWRMTVSDSEIA
jgi:hypothetical protein